MLFNGSAGSELFEASANGGRVRFTRNLGNIVMDADDVENLDLNALGGTDVLTANDLSGTDLVDIDTGLAAVDRRRRRRRGGRHRRRQRHQRRRHHRRVRRGDVRLRARPAHAGSTSPNAEGANDALVINALGGDDGVTSTTLPAGVIKLTVDGGAGEDNVLGSQGADVLLGGSEDDFVFGDNGNDVEFLGAGADVSQWNPGDGNDTLEGQAGDDELLFFGANVAENVNVFANGGRALFTRDVANVTMDMDDLERIEYRALGGADNVVVGDLSGTDVIRVDGDLRGPDGGGDGAADTATVNGTQGADVFGAAGDAGGVNVFGLHARVNLFFQEQANDRLTLNGLGGDDVVDATSLEADGIQLTQNGGLGADVFVGSEGDDLVNGGDGDDTAFMGAGDDTFAWNPGDDNDTLEGQAGFDRMLFNGSNAAETINLQANGGRVRFTRDIAAVVMDLNDVEQTDFNALGGVDRVTVGDLSGTDMTEVNTNLAGAGGVDDAAADTVFATGTNGDDVAIVAGGGGQASAFGLAAQVNVTGAAAGSDRLSISMLGGDDVVDASGLQASGPALSVDGGDQNDVIIGGDGDDTLLGGDGDDVLLGGPGNDVIDGGPGDNVVIQSLGADTTSAAAVAGEQWLATHAGTVGGETVLEVGGEERTLPEADLADLAAGAV